MSSAAAVAATGTNSARLSALGIVLPPVPTPAAAYVPAVRHGDLVFVSGQLPVRDGALVATGLVGDAPDGVDLGTAAALARLCALNVLAAGASVAGGLDAIAGVVRCGVFVASAPAFAQQHRVADGASALLAEVLGPGSVHARMAVGVVRLPLDAPVEVEAVLALSR